MSVYFSGRYTVFRHGQEHGRVAEQRETPRIILIGSQRVFGVFEDIADAAVLAVDTFENVTLHGICEDVVAADVDGANGCKQGNGACIGSQQGLFATSHQ